MHRLSALVAPMLLTMLALTGCADAAGPGGAAPTTPAASGAAESCDEVTLAVDFGVLEEPAIRVCVDAGPAVDALEQAGVTTEGTADFGDQVVCRVNGHPRPDETVRIDGVEPFVESCQTLNSLAYWALWVRPSPEAAWEYAQEGLGTLELRDGQSVGLVYTPGTESLPPAD